MAIPLPLRAGLMVPAALSLVLTAACKPTIDSFRAEPNVTCRGSAVHLTWRASSGGTLMSVPLVAGLGPVDGTGHRDVTPLETTRFRFQSTNAFGAAARDVDVGVRSAPEAAKPIGGSVANPATRCGADGVSITVEAPAADWDEHLRVRTIEIGGGVKRPYRVAHGGKTADLAPGTPSAALQALPIRGTWNISTPLQTGEACGENIPHTLLINVFADCAP